MDALLSIVALALAIVALSKVGPLAARLVALEGEVRQLRRLLARQRGGIEPEGEAEVGTAEPAGKEVPAIAPSVPSAETSPAGEREEDAALATRPEAPAAFPAAPRRLEAGAPGGPAARIEWERWFGVRAAAILGGIALALAGLLFFKYSVEHGLLPPWLRVVLGTVVGIGCIAASEGTLRRRYAVTANALAGGGAVVLYAAFWAATALYGLVALPVGGGLMVSVTVACCALAARHSSLEIALLGLVGGFATPLLLSSHSDRPIGLFAYVLLLDVALIVLAQRRRWPLLAPLCLAATVAYEAFWIGVHLDPPRLALALGILALFAVVFAASGRFAPDTERARWGPTQAAAVILPFAFALYFAANANFGPHLNGLAALVLLLSLAAGWLGNTQGVKAVALGASTASLAIIGVWALPWELSTGLAWELAAWSGAIALAFHVFVEREPERTDADGPALPAGIAAGGLFAVLLLAALRSGGLWPWIAGWAGLAAIMIRQGTFPAREPLQPAAAVGLAVALAAFRAAHGGAPWFPPLISFLALPIAAAIALQVVALIRVGPTARRHAEHAAALLPALSLLFLIPAPSSAWLPVLFLGGTSVLGMLVVLAATRLDSGKWMLAAVLLTGLVQYGWTLAEISAATTPVLGGGLLVQAFSAALFTVWPFLAAARFRGNALAWKAAAMAGPVWFMSLLDLFRRIFGSDFIGLLPLVLAAGSLLAVSRARGVWLPTAAERDRGGEPLRTTTLAWFAAAALGFTTVAIPLQLERQWITIGWALEGLAVLVLWTRLDYPGLKYFGLALLAAATVRLVANPAVLFDYPRPAWRIVNWILYTYLVPAAALLGASRVLAGREVERLRQWERKWFFGYRRPIGAIAAGFAGLLVIFVWLNLAIADWFATGDTLAVSLARMPARDLATSIAWAVYALVLLGAGMWRRSIGLRWASLGLLLITIAKVFLYDLGELRDLYRVASLLGLAVSLIAVSLAYQRFVFRKPGENPS